MSSPDDRLIITRSNLQLLVDKIKAGGSGGSADVIMTVNQTTTVDFTANTIIKVSHPDSNVITVILGTANEGTKVTVVKITNDSYTTRVGYNSGGAQSDIIILQPNVPVNFMYINGIWVCNSFAVWA